MGAHGEQDTWSRQEGRAGQGGADSPSSSSSPPPVQVTWVGLQTQPVWPQPAPRRERIKMFLAPCSPQLTPHPHSHARPCPPTPTPACCSKEGLPGGLIQTWPWARPPLPCHQAKQGPCADISSLAGGKSITGAGIQLRVSPPAGSLRPEAIAVGTDPGLDHPSCWGNYPARTWLLTQQGGSALGAPMCPQWGGGGLQTCPLG